jgi:hypothetical protein
MGEDPFEHSHSLLYPATNKHLDVSVYLTITYFSLLIAGKGEVEEAIGEVRLPV